MNATLPEGATETGASLSEHDAVAALASLRAAPTKDAKPEAPADETPEVTETETEVATDAQDPNPEDAPETEAEAADLPAIAKALGLDVDDLVANDDGTVSIKTKVDGQDGAAKPSDLRKSHQMESSFTHKSMLLAEERKQFETAKETETQAITQKRQELDVALHVASQILEGKFAGVDWDKLRAEDPIGFLTMKEERDQHVRMLQGLYGNLTKAQQESLKKQQDGFNEWAMTQAKELVNAVPEWRKPEVAEKAIKGMFDVAKADYGFTQPELDQLMDHRMIRVLKDATAWRQLQGKQAGVMQRVNKAPVLAKPGSGQKSNTTSLQQAQARFNADPSERNAAALMTARREQKGQRK